MLEAADGEALESNNYVMHYRPRGGDLEGGVTPFVNYVEFRSFMLQFRQGRSQTTKGCYEDKQKGSASFPRCSPKEMGVGRDKKGEQRGSRPMGPSEPKKRETKRPNSRDSL